MHEMLVHNWMTSSQTPPGIDQARKRVWSRLESMTQPTRANQIWNSFTWFFVQPIRTLGFSVALLFLVVIVGHVIPSQLQVQKWQQTQAVLDTEVLILEQENELLEYVLN